MDSAAVYWGSKIVALTNKIVKGEIRNFDIFPALQCVRKYSYFLLVIVWISISFINHFITDYLSTTDLIICQDGSCKSVDSLL